MGSAPFDRLQEICRNFKYGPRRLRFLTCEGKTGNGFPETDRAVTSGLPTTRLATTRKVARPVNTSALERSRWRDGRFACYAPYVMLQGRAFDCDFRFPLIFLSQAKSIGCKRKKIQFP